jgi:hypothetical protein
MGSSKKKREKDKESDRKKHKRDKKDRDDKKSRDKGVRRREDDDELLNYALHDSVQVQQNVYDYGHGFISKGEFVIS